MDAAYKSFTASRHVLKRDQTWSVRSLLSSIVVHFFVSSIYPRETTTTPEKKSHYKTPKNSSNPPLKTNKPFKQKKKNRKHQGRSTANRSNSQSFLRRFGGRDLQTGHGLVGATAAFDPTGSHGAETVKTGGQRSWF